MGSYWLPLLLRVLVIERSLKLGNEACLIPTLKPGQILIVDNAAFPKGGNIIQLIEAAGCQLKYLPSYSPDLNKIERCWSWLKSRIRKQRFSIRLSERCNGSCTSHSGLTALAVAIIRLLKRYKLVIRAC